MWHVVHWIVTSVTFALCVTDTDMFRCVSRTALLGLATSLVCVRTVRAAALVRPALGTSTHAAAVLLARRSSMSGSGSLEQQIQDNISSNKVLVYSKSTCPFCSQCANAPCHPNSNHADPHRPRTRRAPPRVLSASTAQTVQPHLTRSRVLEFAGPRVSSRRWALMPRTSSSTSLQTAPRYRPPSKVSPVSAPCQTSSSMGSTSAGMTTRRRLPGAASSKSSSRAEHRAELRHETRWVPEDVTPDCSSEFLICLYIQLRARPVPVAAVPVGHTDTTPPHKNVPV